MTEVVALFATRMDAERAIESLETMGHDASSIGYMNRHSDDVETVDHDVERDHDAARDHDGDGDHDEMSEGAKGAAGGAMGGAAVGAGTGLLASAGMLLIPGIGPFLAAGTLAGTLGAAAAGAAGGAVLGGAAGAIFGDDNDHEHSTDYREGVEEGGSLVTVDVHDGDTAAVTSMLRDMGAKKVNVHHDDTGWID